MDLCERTNIHTYHMPNSIDLPQTLTLNSGTSAFENVRCFCYNRCTQECRHKWIICGIAGQMSHKNRGSQIHIAWYMSFIHWDPCRIFQRARFNAFAMKVSIQPSLHPWMIA